MECLGQTARWVGSVSEKRHGGTDCSVAVVDVSLDEPVAVVGSFVVVVVVEFVVVVVASRLVHKQTDSR